MVNLRTDEQFGLALTLASGGVLIKVLQDAITLLLPLDQADIEQALDRLRIAPLLNGFRGAPAVNKNALARTITQLVDFCVEHRNTISEIEINPLFVYAESSVVIDALIHASSELIVE